MRAQTSYWQQSLKYKIDASLDDVKKEVSAKEQIIYKNNSPQTLDFIWFHIWPEAYNKSKNTMLYQQLRRDKAHRRHISSYESGAIKDLQFTIEGEPAQTEAHPVYVDVIKLKLNKPLKSGDSVNIESSFIVKLPTFFSRSGYTKDQFMICQWYPKPAVFDKSGWHEFPYLDMGEFYSEYASYDVNIKLPASYVVAATGVLQNKDELDRYKKLGAANVKNNNYAPLKYLAPSGMAEKTLSYKADSVPDFAWFASRNFVIQYDTLQLKSGKVIDAFTYYFDRGSKLWSSSVEYVKDATKKYSNWIGEYAYPTVQAVEGPSNLNSGGMEYPMVTLITVQDDKDYALDAVIAHEVGHNWFMSMLGSNEREHPWLDEGLNTYFELRYEAEKYRYNSIFGDKIPGFLKKASTESFQSQTYSVMASLDMKTPIETSSSGYRNNDDYAMSSYVKPALWLYRLEQSVGTEGMNKAFRRYFNEWKFRHPGPLDMKKSFEDALGFNIDAWFNLIYRPGGL